MKKQLVFILILTLCVSLLSVGAWAADETWKHSNHEGWTELTVEALEKTDYTLHNGNYYFRGTSDGWGEVLETTKQIKIIGIVTLCLNNTMYTYEGDADAAIVVGEGANLTICRCQGDEWGNYDGMISNSNVSYGIYNNGTLTVTGGGIAINKENGAAIYNAGTCTISGGSMSGTAGKWGNFKTAYGIFNAKDASLSISGSPSISGRAVGDMNDPSGPQIDILTYDTIQVENLSTDTYPLYNIGYYGEAGQVVVNGVSGPSDPNAEGYMEATWPCFTLTYPENAEFIYDETEGTLTYAGHTSLTYGDTNVMDDTYYKVDESGSWLEKGTDTDYDILWDEDSKTLTLNNVTIEEQIENFTYADSLFSVAVEEGITIELIGENSFTVSSRADGVDKDAYAIKNKAGGITLQGDGSLAITMRRGATTGDQDIVGIQAAGAVNNQTTLSVSGDKGTLDTWSGMTGIACASFTNTGTFTAEISDASTACAVNASGEFTNAAGASFTADIQSAGGTGLACQAFENNGTMDIDINGEYSAVGVADNDDAGDWINSGTVTIDVGVDGAPAGALSGIDWRSDAGFTFTNSGTLDVTAAKATASTQGKTQWPVWQFFDTIAVSLMPGEDSTVTNTGTMTLAAHNGYTAGLYVAGANGHSIALNNTGTMDITVDTLGGDNIRAVGIYAEIPAITTGEIGSLPFQVTDGSVRIDAKAAEGASGVMDDACMAVCLVQSFDINSDVPTDTSGLQQIELNDMSITAGGSAIVTGPYTVMDINQGVKPTYTSYINTLGVGDIPSNSVVILPTVSGSVSIDGTLTEGSTLTANVSGLPAGVNAAYQWQRADSADGSFEDIDGATGSEYVLTGDDVGKYIRVVVTPTGDEYGGELTATTESAIQRRSVNIPDTYDIDLIVGEGGEAKTNLSNASAGTTITVTATPDNGYELAYITVDGERIDGTTFKMPDHDVTVRVYFTNGGFPFTDVAPGAWYYDAVSYVYANGLMDGTSATTFAPDANMTRAMLVTILWRMEGEPVVNYLLPFTDVDDGAWYAEAVRWAASEGIVTGVSETSFAPNAEITREQLAAILYRYTGEPATAANLAGYADGASVSAYAVDAMSWCVEHGIITGTTATTLEPQGTATRAQAAAMLMRFAENLK